MKNIIKIKKSLIHGKGVFAKKNIEKDAFIGKFKGKITYKDSKYVLWLCDDEDNYYGIKGKSKLKYLNHSKQPNSEFNDAAELYSLKSIISGEEITIHYGDEWEDA